MALGDVVYEKVIDFAVTPNVPTTLFGTGISAAYESVSKTLQASIGLAQGGVIFSGEPTCQEYDAECELTLKIVSDSAGRKHVGGWLVTPTGTQANGYRFFALDNTFGISKWINAVESSVQSASNSTGSGLVVGQSYRVKFTKVGTNLTLYVNDVQVMQASDNTHFNLRPALFLYGCTVQVSKIIWRHLDSALTLGGGENPPHEVHPCQSGAAQRVPAAGRGLGQWGGQRLCGPREPHPARHESPLFWAGQVLAAGWGSERAAGLHREHGHDQRGGGRPPGALLRPGGQPGRRDHEPRQRWQIPVRSLVAQPPLYAGRPGRSGVRPRRLQRRGGRLPAPHPLRPR